jgi:hypothetical protein
MSVRELVTAVAPYTIPFYLVQTANITVVAAKTVGLAIALEKAIADHELKEMSGDTTPPGALKCTFECTCGAIPGTTHNQGCPLYG